MDLSALMQPQKISMLVVPLAVFLATVLVGYIVRKILFNRLVYFTRNTKTQIDDIIIAATKGPFIIWCVMLGIYWALGTAHVSDRWVFTAGKILKILWILSVTIVASSIVTRMIKVYASRVEGTLPVSSLTQNIARIVIFGAGIMVILHSLGVSVAPMLATLGVGGLAVALALQDTLANLFAGIFVTVNKQIKVGDYIRLDSGQEGYIVDINWRSTKIRMAPNNLIFVPNAKLTQSIITNYYLPTRDTDVPIVFGVHYDSDMPKVERVVGEVAAATIAALPDNTFAGSKPVVRFTGLGNSQIDMVVVIRANQFESQHVIKHTFIKMLLERFRREGIVVPYPIYAINYAQEKAS